MIVDCYRQGDILFIPTQMDKEKRERIFRERPHINIIAEGEQSGHLHEIADPKTAVMVDIEKAYIDGVPNSENYEKLLHAEKETTIQHPEHKEITLPEGDYFVRTQREYDEQTMSHRVMD